MSCHLSKNQLSWGRDTDFVKTENWKFHKLQNCNFGTLCVIANHLQVWAGSENDKGGDGHGKEEDQQEQSIDHKSHLYV